MALIVIERDFPEPQDYGELQAMEDAKGWCLEARGVVFLYTLFSTDRRRMLCFYEAPDAEAVREAQREAGLPFTAAWSAVRME